VDFELAAVARARIDMADAQRTPEERRRMACSRCRVTRNDSSDERLGIGDDTGATICFNSSS
jgi:hypothetical protein